MHIKLVSGHVVEVQPPDGVSEAFIADLVTPGVSDYVIPEQRSVEAVVAAQDVTYERITRLAQSMARTALNNS